ncbi:MAG: hypothetical protein IJE87_03285, partial [Firmicutes bacterium]|nr:hypothetical protein [Bacillota bacterium]
MSYNKNDDIIQIDHLLFQYQREENNSLSAAGQNRCRELETKALIKLIDIGGECHEGHNRAGE